MVISELHEHGYVNGERKCVCGFYGKNIDKNACFWYIEYDIAVHSYYYCLMGLKEI